MLRFSISATILLAAAQADSKANPIVPTELLTGIFSNEEQVYFEKEAGKTPPPWFSMRIAATANGVKIEEIDAFGAAKDPGGHPIRIAAEGATTVLDYGKCQRLYRTEGNALVANGVRGKCSAPATMTRIAPDGITLTYPDGKTSLLRRARTVTCWSAIPRGTKKADGSDEWFFARDIKIHDQGGRALVGRDAPDVKPAVIRMRNVVWATGNNRPSLVLYVHTPDEPDNAVSYVWADPGAARIGINLRRIQASCTVDGAEKPAA